MDEFEDFKIEDESIDIKNMFDVEDNYKIVKTRYCKPKIFKGVRKVKYKKAIDLAKEIGKDVFSGERIFAIVSGAFIFGDIIEALLEENPSEFIEEITLSTLSINIENIGSLRNIVEMKQCNKINLIVSDYYYAHNRQNIEFIYEELDRNNNFRLGVAGIHTKMILMRMKSGKKIVIHGSANLRSSSSMEQIMIETSDELYDFSYEFHDAIINKFGTINKAVRGNALWNTIKGK